MEIEFIQNKIYEIRGYKVMLDFDLAQLYGTETAQLKRQVRRNIERFEGEDFMFEVTMEELSRCQIGILNSRRGGNIKYKPFAFTELGVSMLSSVLNSKAAIDINRRVMRAFVAMRHLVLNPPANDVCILQMEVSALKEYIEEVFTDLNDINEDTRMQLELINQSLAGLHSLREKLEVDPNRRRIGYVKNSNEGDV